jgi:hypothetical protein
MEQATPPTGFCPHCQAENPTGAARCWICQQPLEAAGPEHAAAPAANPATPKRTFHLNSLMLVIALVAVFLGVWRAAWGLAILFALVALPASLRTWGILAERRALNQPLRIEEKIFAFLGSLGVVLAIGLAACIAFYATCWIGVGLGSLGNSRESYDWIIILGLGGMVLGIPAAIFAGMRVKKWLWKRKN